MHECPECGGICWCIDVNGGICTHDCLATGERWPIPEEPDETYFPSDDEGSEADAHGR